MTSFWIITSLLTVYSLIVTYYCLRFALTVLRVQESLEKGLQIIDEKHQNIAEILKRPLFFDSLEVRQVLRDIESTQDALHEIAYDMSANLTDEEVES